MAIIVKLGSTVPVPCRACSRKLLPFVVEAGRHALVCPDCKGTTRVEVNQKSGRWQIRTSRGG